MSGLPQKIPFRCPTCGVSQMEPPRMVTTICRSCGTCFGKSSFPGVSPLPAIPAEPAVSMRAVRCYRCGRSHEASTKAQSTQCPGCGTGIELCDVELLSSASRLVDTRGELRIGPSASLSSSRIVCGSARLQGRVVGYLMSEGEVRIGTNAVCACHITAPVIVIEKNARPTFLYALHTEKLVVFGCLTGIIHCRGVVHVRRGGRLEAEVHARSVTVEKGGILMGACHVNGGRPQNPPDQQRELPLRWPESLCPAQ